MKKELLRWDSEPATHCLPATQVLYTELPRQLNGWTESREYKGVLESPTPDE